jgi:D-alanyl-D-alanine carboxypeptidase (penicillin-binding protein 5/6)
MVHFRKSRPVSAIPTALALAVGLLTGVVPAVQKAQAQGIESRAREAFLVDFETGSVLLDKNSDTLMPPSSMSKLMSSVMVFERLKEGSLSLDEKFRVSENAWRKGGAASGGSTMFLEPFTEARVEDLLRGIIVQSGNDACVVVAEALMGSEDAFAQAMTARAREIGLTKSVFINATGLPDAGHLMTPRDLATLARYIINTFPEYYSLYSEMKFSYNGINQSNRNPLLYTMRGADGLKTGHTEVAGYGLTASAVEGDRRQILVINGLDSVKARSEEAQRLMDWGFRNFENRRLFTAGETVSTAEVWLGQADTVGMLIEGDLKLTVPRRAAQNLEVKVVYNGPMAAPIAKGQQIAVLKVGGTDMQTLEFPLVAAEDVPRLGFVGRMGAAMRHLLFGFAS